MRFRRPKLIQLFFNCRSGRSGQKWRALHNGFEGWAARDIKRLVRSEELGHGSPPFLSRPPCCRTAAAQNWLQFFGVQSVSGTAEFGSPAEGAGVAS